MKNKLVASALMSLVLSAGMAAAQNAPATDKSSPEAARLTSVSVHRGKEGVSVEITCSRPITPTPQMISDPSRLVLDFADTILAEPRSHISVNHDGLKSVRIGVQPLDPPTTRVVLDLDVQRVYQLIPDGNKLTVKLGEEDKSSALAANDPKSVEQTASQPSPASEAAATEKSPAPSEAPANTSGTADSASVPDAEPKAADSARASAAAKSVSPAGETNLPVQIASNDPSAAVAASVPSTDNMPAAAEHPAETKPVAEPADGVLAAPLAVGNSGAADKQTATASAETAKAAAVPAKSDEKSSSVAAQPPAVSPASTQPLLLSSARVTPELPPVTPPADLPVHAAAQPTPSDYVIGEQDVLNIVVWKERELSGEVVVRPDGKITLPLVNEITVVGMTPAQLQALLIEKFKPFLTIPQVTVEVVQINSRKAYLIGEVQKTGTFPLNSSTTVLQIIAQAGGLRDFAKRKDIYILRNQKGHQARYRFNYDDVIRGKNTQQNIVLQPGDMVVVP